MRASVPILPLISRCMFPPSKNLIAQLLLLCRVLLIHLARVYKQRHVRLAEFLQVCRGFEQGRMRNDRNFDNAIECQVEDVASTEAVACCSERGDAALFETSDDLVERRTCLITAVAWEPGAEVELAQQISD